MTDEVEALIREALRIVIDPELGENIVDLGFIYDISVVDGVARIVMTATTPGCPAAGFLKEGVEVAAAQVPGITSVEATITFEPRWTPALIDPAARASLGFGGD